MQCDKRRETCTLWSHSQFFSLLLPEMEGLICNFCSYSSLAKRLRNAPNIGTVLPQPTALFYWVILQLSKLQGLCMLKLPTKTSLLHQHFKGFLLSWKTEWDEETGWTRPCCCTHSRKNAATSTSVNQMWTTRNLSNTCICKTLHLWEAFLDLNWIFSLRNNTSCWRALILSGRLRIRTLRMSMVPLMLPQQCVYPRMNLCVEWRRLKTPGFFWSFSLISRPTRKALGMLGNFAHTLRASYKDYLRGVRKGLDVTLDADGMELLNRLDFCWNPCVVSYKNSLCIMRIGWGTTKSQWSSMRRITTHRCLHSTLPVQCCTALLKICDRSAQSSPFETLSTVTDVALPSSSIMLRNLKMMTSSLSSWLWLVE